MTEEKQSMTEPNTDWIAEIEANLKIVRSEIEIFKPLSEVQDEKQRVFSIIESNIDKLFNYCDYLLSQLTAAQALLASVQDDLTQKLYEATQPKKS